MSTQDNDLPVVDEITVLKERATQLGIKFHPSIGLASLREKVNAKIEGTNLPEDGETADETPVVKKETENERRTRLYNEAARLVRIRVTCMNPAKREWEGELFTVGNSTVGTFKKFVPFNAEDGWHVPHMMYEMIKARECQVFYTEKTKNGVSVRRGKLIKEFAVELLDQLTPAELQELALRQAAAHSIG